MPNTPFHHPYRIDAQTFHNALGLPGLASFVAATQLPDSVRFLAVDPTIFTQAYLLLGAQPQRFGNDLTLYLATVRTFFERVDAVGGITVPAIGDQDFRRRLSEDLGVGLAAYFMVQMFGLTWDSISQIPQNANISKKRPDFQGYTAANLRFLFETKGTTKMSGVEDALSNALDQVKRYPEPANAKVAVVSYLSADERFFPSTSFVVDPPALPDEVKPDAETSRLLHFEKVLQYAGLPLSAKVYVSTLSRKLREQHRTDQGFRTTARGTAKIEQDLVDLKEQFEAELTPRPGIIANEIGFAGQIFESAEIGLKLFFGVALPALTAGIEFREQDQKLPTQVTVTENEVTSTFSDGTLLRVTPIERVKQK